MTAKPTADEARLRKLHDDAVIAACHWNSNPCERTRDRLNFCEMAFQDALQSALAAVEKIERVAKLREEAMARDLTAALARAEAAEINLRSVMKRSDHWQSRAEAAEKERDELLKHCTALERESFENLIEHEKWQEREAIYRSQIEAGANLRPDGQTGGK
jgi:DNA primase large subunit